MELLKRTLLLTCALLIGKIHCIHCFNVNFHWDYEGIRIAPFEGNLHKRGIGQFFDKASYTFNGLEKIESVPVLFPSDICLMSLEGVKYAAALHKSRDGIRHFAVFKMSNDGQYETLMDMPTPIAIALDCRAMGAKGYAAIAYNITDHIEFALKGSPIFEISGRRVRAIQYFMARDMRAMYLLATGNDFMLLQTFHNTRASPNLRCPFFLWSGSTFTKTGYIPCSNARDLEMFSIDFESYVAVANYADQRGRTATYSEVYKLLREKRKFQLVQKIRTNGAVDVRQFSVPIDEVRQQHFLVFGNSIGDADGGANSKNLEADSVFYVFDKGQFIPYQRLSFYAVEQFLPVQNTDAEKFLLLVACTNQDIKIYNLNDWKFEESQTQFTEGALSRGISKMRIYQDNDTSYLVIANELMSAQETNVFLPIFQRDEKANILRREIIDWTKTNIERLQQIDVAGLARDVETKLQQQQKSNRKISLDITELSEPNIETVITKSLTYPRLHMNGKYWKALDFANQALDALQKGFISPGLSHRPKRSVGASMEPYDYEELSVRTLKINNHLKARKINGIEIVSEETSPDEKSIRFKSIKAPQVIVMDKYTEVPVLVNSTATTKAAARSSFNEARFPINPLMTNDDDDDDDKETLNVKNLHVSGTLNGLTLEQLVNDTLKRSGQQVFNAPITIASLRAHNVTVRSEIVSDRHLDDLVRTDDGAGNYEVKQDLRFISPVQANNLRIRQRLNNIPVGKDGKLEVLLKNSSATQVVTGAKSFDAIRVLEPISIAGKMEGRRLKSISPKRAIHEDLVLEGDYVISGNVTIEEFLRTHDLIDETANLSARKIVTNGVRMNEVLENVNLKFEEPLDVNNSVLSFINEHDLQKLIKLNMNEIQVVEGEKVFQNGLDLSEGFSEVRHLNGVDVEELPERLLLKTTNQTIRAPLHVGTVLTKSVLAEELALNDTSPTEYLTLSGNQTIRGPLRVKRLRTQTLNTTKLNTNGLVFGHTLSAIYQRKSRNAPQPSTLFRKNEKFPGTLHADHINMPPNSTLNGRFIGDILQQAGALKGIIKFVGNIQLHHDVNVSHLSFAGRLNGIPAHEFGRMWLQREGAQDFLAPQTIADITVDNEKGVHLTGRLNRVDLDDFYLNALWINRPEYVAEARFRDSVEVQGTLYTSTLNGLRVPHDMVYRSATQPQVLTDVVTIAGDFAIFQPQQIHEVQEHANIWNTTILNGMPLDGLGDFLNGARGQQDTLFVEDANFQRPPQFRTINGHDLQATLDRVWLSNENVALPQQVHFSEAHFQGLLELLDGPINGVHLPYLMKNYLSLSKPQEIATEIHFVRTVNLECDFTAANLDLYGPVIEAESKRQFDFDHFVSHSVKTAGPHTVTGEWQFAEASVLGPLRNVLVNDLKLVDDVVLQRQGAESPELLIKITAPKRATTAGVARLHVTPQSTVAGVNVHDWLQRTVYVHGNHTIDGTITLERANFLSDLQVHGRVNNITFNADTIMLREHEGAQILRGDMLIRSKRPLQPRALTVNFDSLRTERINGVNVSAFLAEQIVMGPEVEVRGHLVFQQPLRVEEYHNVLPDAEQGNGDQMKLKRNTLVGNSTQGNGTETKTLARSLFHQRPSAHSIIQHFELLQTIPVNASNVIPLTLRLDNAFHDIVGIQLASNDTLQYYRWNTTTQAYERDEAIERWLPQHFVHLALWRVLFANAAYLSVEGRSDSKRTPPNEPNTRQVLSQTAMAHIEELLQPERNHLLPVQLNEESDCVALVQQDGLGQRVPIYCLAAVPTGSSSTDHVPLQLQERASLERSNVEQVITLTATKLALLAHDAVQVWSTAGERPALLQLLSLEHRGRDLVGVIRQGVFYLAALTTTSNAAETATDNKNAMPPQWAIEIYRSTTNPSSSATDEELLSFQHMQTLHLPTPAAHSLAFQLISETDDLLLHTLTPIEGQSLLVHQYRGVEGFVPIVSTSTLPVAEKLQVLELKVAQRHQLALLGHGECTFVNIALEQL